MKENNTLSFMIFLKRIVRKLHEEYEIFLDKMADMTVSFLDDRKGTAYK